MLGREFATLHPRPERGVHLTVALAGQTVDAGAGDVYPLAPGASIPATPRLAHPLDETGATGADQAAGSEPTNAHVFDRLPRC